MPMVKNNAKIVDTCTQRLQALKAHVPAKSEIAIDGTTYKVAALVAIYQADLDTRAALIKSRAQAKVDLNARSVAAANRNAIEPGLRAWVLGQFGASSNEALEFGYSPRKVGTVTAAKRADAVKLGEATRKARGTMGKKQKLKIKGTLVAPTAPAAPAIPMPAPPAVTASPAASVATANGAQAPSPNGAAHES
jgi:hypothetical protein